MMVSSGRRMQQQSVPFSSVAVLSRFHPRARTLWFRRRPDTGAVQVTIIYADTPMDARTVLEAELALASSLLVDAAGPDFHAFCRDIEMLIQGAQPSAPVERLALADWTMLRRISSYAQHWRQRNPAEVDRLLSFMMCMPAYSRLAAIGISRHGGADWQDILALSARGTGGYLIGVSRFHSLFQRQLAAAMTQANQLLSVCHGDGSASAARRVKALLGSRIDEIR